MKNRITLSIDHANAKRMEYFLNALEDEIRDIPVNWQQWKLSDRMSGGCKFKSTGEHPLTITVLFCDSYNDANDIAKANNLPTSPTAKWSVNGDLLYLVESGSAEKVSKVLSLFAAEE